MLQIVVEAAWNVCVNHDPHALESGGHDLTLACNRCEQYVSFRGVRQSTFSPTVWGLVHKLAVGFAAYVGRTNQGRRFCKLG